MAALHIRRADLCWNAAYDVARYCYYFGGAVAARCFGYRKVRYAVGFRDGAMGEAIAEGITDRILVRTVAVRRNLRFANHTLANILNEAIGVFARALAGQVGNDRATFKMRKRRQTTDGSGQPSNSRTTI